MALNDTLANLMSKILNSGNASKKTCTVSPVSKQIIKVLEIMKDNGYIGDFKITKNNKGDEVEINLLDKINKCGAIKPRFACKKEQIDGYETRYLPAKNFGIIIISTSQGMMIHTEAHEKELGGRLIAYVY
jgi:small subunit ribosomal protein S8